MRSVVVVVALCSCGHHGQGTGKLDGGSAADDGPTSTGDGPGGDAANSGSTSIDGQMISCYSQGTPTATCTLPTHCCFSNFSAQHDGSCGTSACAWGTIECDGPEDCTNGGHCCATQLSDSSGIIGYRLACQAAACGSQPTHEELCHQGGPACANGGSCVTAYGTNNDLPRSLYICR